MDKTKLEKELSSYMGRLLRENFGRGPGGVFTVISPPFITVYFKAFLLPLEKVLLDKEQVIYVQKTRDLLMETLIEEIKGYIQLNIHLDIKEFYYDWNLELQSGMFIMIHSDKENIANHSYKNQKLLHKEVEEVTQKALNRWSYRTFLDHPKDNRFTGKQFVSELEKNGINVGDNFTHWLFSDIVIRVGKKVSERLLAK